MEKVFTRFHRKFSEYLYEEYNGINQTDDNMGFAEITLRQKYLITYLHARPRSFVEIENYLDLKSTELALDLRISLRTLQRDIRNIEIIYHLQIIFDRYLSKYRFCEADESLAHREILLNHLDIILALSSGSALNKHIQLQPSNKSGTKYLRDLLTAISDKKEISFLHIKDFQSRETERKLYPMGIKEYHQRWYVYGHDLDRDSFRLFALDRVHNLKVRDAKSNANDYDPQEYFKFSFGVEITINEIPIEISILLKDRQANFLKTVPLHQSQQIASEENGTVRFKFLLVPKHNFQMTLLSYGAELLDVTPDSLRRSLLEKLNTCTSNLTTNLK